VAGTPLVCFAITSNNKNGMGCVLWKGGKPMVGSYTVGLAVDGTASVEKIKADGSGQSVFKRKLQSKQTVYKAKVGDLFGFQASKNLAVACGVANVTSSALQLLYRGVRVTCLRVNGKTSVPSSYMVSITAKFAGVSKLDAKSRIAAWGFVEKQPSAGP
jgi:hypothetical protein